MPNANALPALGGPALPMTYGEALTSFRTTIAGIQALTQQVLGIIAAGPTAPAQNIVNMSDGFYRQTAALTQIAALGGGLAAYALTQGPYFLNLGSANILSGFAAIVAALNAVTAWIGANAPANSLAPNSAGQWATAQVPQADLAPLVALLNALSATIA